MHSDTEKAKKILDERRCSCVFCRGEEIEISEKSGVNPVLDRLEAGSTEGVCVADKIVGKAAAMLFVLGRVREVYAALISRDGAAMLDRHGIPVYYEKKVDYIVNRTGTGRCPMENAVADIDDPAMAPEILRKTMADLRAAAGQAPGKTNETEKADAE